MKEISEKIESFEDKWQNLYKMVLDNDSQWKAHLPYSSPTEVNEVIKTIINLFERVRAPKGFEPNFHLSKGLALSLLSQSITYLQNVISGTWGQLPNLITNLNQILACFHNMFVFSDKKQTRDSIAELGDKLAQALALVDTAQDEMKNKIETLEKSEEVAEQVENDVEIIKKVKSQSESLLSEIENYNSTADSLLAKIKEQEEKITTLMKSLQSEIDRSSDLQDTIDEQNEAINKIKETIIDQQNTIKHILPTAASAGLAHSFKHRLDSLNYSKYTWLGLFLFSISGLIGVGIWIFLSQSSTPSDIWQGVIERLPLTAPLIWLGWISALQYGNVIRVQEDYAFKEATSKAYEGYRDHMEHLSSVNDESSKTALDLLSQRTIDILSRSPLRIYRKSEDDVSFWKSFINRNKKSEIPDDE